MQVGNPFLEKLLMEACLRADGGAPRLDRRAAGPGRGRADERGRRVRGEGRHRHHHRRREGAAARGRHDAVRGDAQRVAGAHARHRQAASTRPTCARSSSTGSCTCETIGVVTDDGLVRIRDGDVEVARVPAKLLTDAPTYVREGVKPRWLDELQEFDLSQLPDVGAARTTAAERAIDDERHAARAAGVAGDRVEAAGLAAVRPPGRHEHRRRAGQRRRGDAHQGHEEGARDRAPTATPRTRTSTRTPAARSPSPRRRATSPAPARSRSR